MRYDLGSKFVYYLEVGEADIKNGLNFILQGVRACQAAHN